MEAKSGYMLVNIKAAKAKASLMNFLEAHGMSAKELTADEAEDLGLLMMMLGVDRTKKVSRDTIMRKLKR